MILLDQTQLVKHKITKIYVIVNVFSAIFYSRRLSCGISVNPSRNKDVLVNAWICL